MPPLLALIAILALTAFLGFIAHAVVTGQPHPFRRVSNFVHGRTSSSSLSSPFLTDACEASRRVPDWTDMRTYGPELLSEIAKHRRKCTCLVQEPAKQRVSDHYKFAWSLLTKNADAARKLGYTIVDANFLYLGAMSSTEMFGNKMDGVQDYELCVYMGSRGEAAPYIQCDSGTLQVYHSLHEGFETTFDSDLYRVYVNQTPNPTIILRVSFMENDKRRKSAEDPIKALIASLFGFN